MTSWQDIATAPRDGTWKAAVWDRPQNGTRYYVCRGEEAAGTATGGVYTFKSRDHAKQYAEQLNRAIAAPPQAQAQGAGDE